VVESTYKKLKDDFQDLQNAYDELLEQNAALRQELRNEEPENIQPSTKKKSFARSIRQGVKKFVFGTEGGTRRRKRVR